MEESKHINESADKIVLKANVKRGNDTRDEDKINIKVKGNDPQETAQKLQDTLLAIKSENTHNELRNTQAGSQDLQIRVKGEGPDMQFIEVENQDGESVNAGEWVGDGEYHVLKLE